MVDLDNITVEVELDLKNKNWNLELMEAMFGDNLNIQNDYEYAIGVLLGYGTYGGVDGDIEDALEEITDTVKHT